MEKRRRRGVVRIVSAGGVVKGLGGSEGSSIGM